MPPLCANETEAYFREKTKSVPYEKVRIGLRFPSGDRRWPITLQGLDSEGAAAEFGNQAHHGQTLVDLAFGSVDCAVI